MPSQVQIFGTRKNADTRKALRFFSERGWKAHFVDLDERPLSPGELKRFTDRFELSELVDRASRRFRELGLATAAPAGERWHQRLLDEPLLLRQPLVRYEHRLTVGPDEAAWRSWAAG